MRSGVMLLLGGIKDAENEFRRAIEIVADAEASGVHIGHREAAELRAKHEKVGVLLAKLGKDLGRLPRYNFGRSRV